MKKDKVLINTLIYGKRYGVKKLTAGFLRNKLASCFRIDTTNTSAQSLVDYSLHSKREI